MTFFLRLYCCYTVIIFNLLIMGLLCEDYYEHPCYNDLIDMCAMNSPTSLEDIYFARICLWKNEKELNGECRGYLLQENPSIIEPCYREIESFCVGVSPGFGKVHSCLYDHQHDLNDICLKALEFDSNSTPEGSNIGIYSFELDSQQSKNFRISIISDNSESSYQKLINVYEQILSVFTYDPNEFTEDSYETVQRDMYEEFPDVNAESMDYSEYSSMTSSDLAALLADDPITDSLIDDDHFESTDSTMILSDNSNIFSSVIDNLYNGIDLIKRNWLVSTDSITNNIRRDLSKPNDLYKPPASISIEFVENQENTIEHSTK